MAMKIVETDRSDVVRIACPECGERVRGIGLLRDSTIHGLTFKCKRCGKLWAIESEYKKHRPYAQRGESHILSK